MDAGLIARFASRLDGAAEAGEPMAPAVLGSFCALVPPWSASGLLGVEGGLVHLLAQHGAGGPLFEGLPTRWPLAASPARHVLDSGEPFLCADMQADAAFPLYRIDAGVQGYRAVAVLPTQARDAAGRRLVISLHAPRTHAVAAAEAALLAALARIAGAMLAAERRLEAARGAGREPAAEEGATALLTRIAAAEPVLAETALVFARTGGRYQASADRLGLHVSTLRYRIGRLAERFGLDLADEATRNALAVTSPRRPAR